MPAPKDPIKLAEWKRKLSEKGKGRKTWNTGLKYSELEEFDEYREKLSKAQKDREREPHSEERKKKISDSLKGRGKGKIVSQETRDKLSKSRSGKKHSNASKEKLSKLRADNIIQRKGRSGLESPVYLRGIHISPKAGNVSYRSSYELRAYNILDLDENVLLYLTETIVIPYEYEGVVKNYVPDLFIVYKDGSKKIVEVKPSTLISLPQNQAKFTAARLLYPNFEIWSEDDL